MSPEDIAIITIEGVDRAPEWLRRLRTKPAAIESSVEPTYFEVIGRD